MKISKVVCTYDAEQGSAEEDALKQGMAAKSKEFVEKSGDVYAKVWS